ncbi:MAG: hypothetical protein V1724_05155, partial [Chloroflexota bacterium]
MRSAGLEEETGRTRFDFGLRVDHMDLSQVLKELALEVAHPQARWRVACPKLDLEHLPGNLGRLAQIAQPVG